LGEKIGGAADRDWRAAIGVGVKPHIDDDVIAILIEAANT
jgi:hypothetical protein